jgi:hypothetical protein
VDHSLGFSIWIISLFPRKKVRWQIKKKMFIYSKYAINVHVLFHMCICYNCYVNQRRRLHKLVKLVSDAFLSLWLHKGSFLFLFISEAFLYLFVMFWIVV